MAQQAGREHRAAGQQQDGRRGRPGEQRGPGEGAAHRRQAAGRRREAVRAPRAGPARDQLPVLGGDRAAVGDQVEQLTPQPDRQQGHRQQAEQRGRAELTALALVADIAVLDVPADPLAQQRGELTVPAVQDGGQVGAGVLPGPGHQQRAQRGLELGARTGRQRVRLVARHAQRGGQLGPIQLMPQVQLDDLPLARVQPAQRGPDQLAQLGLFRRLPDVRRGVGHLVRIVQRRGRGAAAQPAVALVPCYRVQPRPQPAGIAQPAQLGGGDDERVLDRVGGVGRLAEHGAAVRVQWLRVTVVRRGETTRLPGHDGRDDLAVLHALTVCGRPTGCPDMPETLVQNGNPATASLSMIVVSAEGEPWRFVRA